MKNDDYGYFGKGVDGYIHYMQFFNETQKGGGRGQKPSSNGGCLTSILYILDFIIIVIVLLTY